MKTAIVICLIVLLTFGCGLVIYGGIADASISEVSIEVTQKTGEIGAFSAVTPTNNATLTAIPAFSWTEAENADTYTLEISSDSEFDIADEYYIVKSGITTTTFNLQADFKKDKSYYWRVTAKNKDHSELITGEALVFFYQATLYEEIPISIGYADEWKVHEVGSKATVTLDHSSFFGEKGNAEDMAAKKDSLRISFDSEDTQRGPEYVESNGWVVVTRSLETEFYGTDAFYFNFYYSGNDASAYFRLIDEDNEYWYAPIKLAVNAKQTIIMRLSDFTLRTKGTPVVNEEFDYHYLKSMEIVFERVDGDGVAYFGNLKAIRFSNYQDTVIDKVNFKQYESSFASDSRYYNFTGTASDSGDTFTCNFTVDNTVPAAQKGFGYIKMDIEKILVSGDAFSFNINIDGIATKDFYFRIRVVEEDKDIWVFKIPAAEIPTDGNLLVPFSAFLLDSGGFKGDGIRQFYYIKQLHFYLLNCYQAGQFSVSNFEVVSLSDKVENLYKSTVSTEGMIDDFEAYQNVVDVYYKWEPTTANKDEAISLYKDTALGAKNHAAKLYYKSDLSDAAYHTLFDSVEGYSAIQVYAKDVPVGSFKATMTIYLIGGPNELYSYEIKNLDSEWMRYTIPISEFNITADSYGSQHITCENITGIALAFKATSSILKPDYASGSYVCVDNVSFTNATAFEKVEAASKIKMSTENPNVAVISDFDNDTAKTLRWTTDSTKDWHTLTLTDDTASGEGQCLEMGYKTKMDSNVFYLITEMDDSVSANGLTFAMKGDQYSSKATIVLYVSANNQTYRFQKEVTNLSSDWTMYSIGFNSFTKTQGDSSFTWSAAQAKNIVQISINYQNYSAADYYVSKILLDDVCLSKSIALDAFGREAIQ